VLICSGAGISYALWDNFATNFLSNWNCKTKPEAMVIILTEAKIRPPSFR